jgi:hypothetical protein
VLFWAGDLMWRVAYELMEIFVALFLEYDQIILKAGAR